MAYETFERTSVRVEEPALSMAPEGRITLNAAAARVLAEAGVKSVLLLWDRTNYKLAIKATAKGDQNAYAVSFTRGRQAGSLRAKMFFNHIGWSARQRKMLPATWDPKQRMLEVTLPHNLVSSDRNNDTKQRAKTGA
jgi:hypothetical protein